MDMSGLIGKFLERIEMFRPQCILEVRMGGMLVNFGPTTADSVSLEHMGWIYQLIDPEAELLVTCLSFMV